MNNFRVLTKDFSANESAVIDIRSLGLINRFGTLIFENQTGKAAQFSWQRDETPYGEKRTGYFKEIMNDLGVKVSHYKGFITVTNGGGSQHLEVELQV
ncbi:hypothetical protein LF887_00110 [Chryseobacterium sp. MEBOG06]|uniref:hypothetical protein n=1 Tax=unclassified Chryseobacterium TaxID=2593645 RepID=UPI001F3934FF|nr:MULTISPECIES: hypothetical protein [unclassified Chryseobacterium]UKB84087.1 hypothetical protein LF887_00110 [Chryseobacterium sp. MEBOG06]